MSSELPFRADFEASVFAAADAQGRRHARFTAYAAAALFVSAAVVGSVLRPETAVPAVTQAQVQLDITAIDEVQTEPVDYLFPDATPLSEFSDNYTGSGGTSDEYDDGG
jgi:translation elongation factor EF-Tu-like GTPase